MWGRGYVFRNQLAEICSFLMFLGVPPSTQTFFLPPPLPTRLTHPHTTLPGAAMVSTWLHTFCQGISGLAVGAPVGVRDWVKGRIRTALSSFSPHPPTHVKTLADGHWQQWPPSRIWSFGFPEDMYFCWKNHHAPCFVPTTHSKQRLLLLSRFCACSQFPAARSTTNA